MKLSIALLSTVVGVAAGLQPGPERVSNRFDGDCMKVVVPLEADKLTTDPLKATFDVVMDNACDGADTTHWVFTANSGLEARIRYQANKKLYPSGHADKTDEDEIVEIEKAVCLNYPNVFAGVTTAVPVNAADCVQTSDDQGWAIDTATFQVKGLNVNNAADCLQVVGTVPLTLQVNTCVADDLSFMFDFTSVVTPVVGTDLNFVTTLRDTEFNLASAVGNAGTAVSEIIFTYIYGGPADTVFTFPIYPGSVVDFANGLKDGAGNPLPCGLIDTAPSVDYPIISATGAAGPSADTTLGLQVTSIDHSTTDGTVVVKIAIDLEEIEEDLVDPGTPGGLDTFWKYYEQRTKAKLAFCGRLEMYYPMDKDDVEPDGGPDGDKEYVKVNYHETDLIAEVDLLEDGGFQETFVGVNMDRGAITEARPDVSIEYPVRIDFCADDAIIIETPPAVITQGFPIQLCVRLQGHPDVVGAYVQNIWSFTYHSEEVLGPTQGIDEGNADVLTELDCGYDGVCRIKWVPLAKYFRTFSTDVNGRQRERIGTQLPSGNFDNNLVVFGMAVVNFGADSDVGNGKGNGWRRLATIRGSLAMGGRQLQEDVESGVSRIEENVGQIQPEQPKKRNRNKSAASTIVAMVVPALLSIIGFFF